MRNPITDRALSALEENQIVINSLESNLGTVSTKESRESAERAIQFEPLPSRTYPSSDCCGLVTLSKIIGDILSKFYLFIIITLLIVAIIIVLYKEL